MTELPEFEKPTPGRWIKGFLGHYFGGLYRRFGGHHILLLSGGLAFSIFICVVPFVLIVFSALGVILQRASIEGQVISFIEGMIPYPEYSTYVKGIIFSRIDEVIAHKKLAGYLGVVGLLIAASSLFSSMRTVLNTIYGEVEGKNPVIGKLRDFGMIILVLIFFLISTAILPVMEILKETADKAEFLQSLQVRGSEHIIFQVMTFLLVFFMFTILYYLVPYDSIGLGTAVMSALWAAGLWELAKQAFGYYVANFASIGKIYGAYVMVVAIAFWIYYSSVVFMLGAEIGQLYRERKRDIREVKDSWAI